MAGIWRAVLPQKKSTTPSIDFRDLGVFESSSGRLQCFDVSGLEGSLLGSLY